MTRRQRIDGFFGTPRWATIGLLAALLLGVLGMHGLASHGMTGVGHSEMGPAIATTDVPSAVAMSHEDSCEAWVCPPERLGVAAGGDSAGPGLLALCIAVLVGVAALFILSLLAARHAAPHRWVHTHQPIMPVRCGGPDPPNLYELSLLRC